MKEQTRSKLHKLRKLFVVGKFTMQRGYTLLNVPFLALMGAGVLYPYAVQYIPWIKMWSLAIIAFVGILGAGIIDKKFRLLHEEQTYATETNPTLMAGLRGEFQTPKEEEQLEVQLEAKPEEPKSI